MNTSLLLEEPAPQTLADFRRQQRGRRRAEVVRGAPRCLLAVREDQDPRTRARGAAAMLHLCWRRTVLNPRDLRELVVHPLAKREGHPFADLLTIGRGDDNDVVLDHPLVSWFHAYLERDGSHWVLHDVGSAQGTRVDGVEAPPERPVLSRSLIEVAGSVLLVFLEGPDVYDCLIAPRIAGTGACIHA